MTLQLDMWLRFYIDAECHFSHTAMDFFEDYNHTVNTYQLRQPTSGFQYCSRIYCDYLARVDKSQGCLSSLLRCGIDCDHFQQFLAGGSTEHHLFAQAFAYWWNMTETQKRILAEVLSETNWRKGWDILNYFLCNPEAQELPAWRELERYRFRGDYLRWRVDGSPENGEWILIDHPEALFL